MSSFWLASAFSALCIGAFHASAYDNSRKDNLAVYWGQNSYGATHLNDPANWQKSIGYYCQDDTIDAIPVAFLNVFTSTGGYPSLNLANICNTDGSGVFPGTSMPNCTFLASDIEYCQSRGKIVTLSLGGATGAVAFTSSAQASAFGDTIWNVFFGGSDSVRPFGDAVLDGIDLDIEGGTTAYYDSFINRIRELASGAEKPFYLTAAPQCPYPDAYLGTILNQVSFDAVYVQFYNNWCGLQNFDNIWAWDFNSWDNWAKTVSVNPDVKIYIGAPASSTAAGSGYVDATTLANIALETRNDYSSFGGIMLWDASQAYDQERDPDRQWRLVLVLFYGDGPDRLVVHLTFRLRVFDVGHQHPDVQLCHVYRAHDDVQHCECDLHEGISDGHEHSRNVYGHWGLQHEYPCVGHEHEGVDYHPGIYFEHPGIYNEHSGIHFEHSGVHDNFAVQHGWYPDLHEHLRHVNVHRRCQCLLGCQGLGNRHSVCGRRQGDVQRPPVDGEVVELQR
ncbi:glycoside hydrolase superfamily [Trametes elegans]|nr:glycoside hydrolase superfamily [Trametes elegans]